MPTSKSHVSISERKLFLRILDVVISVAGLYVFGLFFENTYFNFDNSSIITWVISLSVYILFFGEVFEMYNLKVASDIYLTLRSTVLTVLFSTLFYVFTPYFSPVLPENRLQIAYFFCCIFLVIIAYRIIYIKFIRAPRFLKNILIIAEHDEIEKVLLNNYNAEVNKMKHYISDKPNLFDVEMEFFDLRFANIGMIVSNNGINEIIVSSNSNGFITNAVNKQLLSLFEKGISIKSVDSFIEDETFKISENRIPHNFYHNFSFSKSHQNNLYVAFHRVMDVIFAIVGIIGLSVFVPFVFIGNLIGNRGELFYLQERVGKKGQLFKIIKFRTMVTDAEQNGAVWATKNDSRVTKFGRLLRKTRIDEVPQFLNVLKGDMSLIGPRPERPEFVELLENEIQFYSVRHVIKPGLTGWAQVMHPYASSVKDQQEKLMYDLYYIKERNLLMDLKIVIKTISTVLFFRGT